MFHVKHSEYGLFGYFGWWQIIAIAKCVTTIVEKFLEVAVADTNATLTYTNSFDSTKPDKLINAFGGQVQHLCDFADRVINFGAFVFGVLEHDAFSPVLIIA